MNLQVLYFLTSLKNYNVKQTFWQVKYITFAFCFFFSLRLLLIAIFILVSCFDLFSLINQVGGALNKYLLRHAYILPWGKIFWNLDRPTVAIKISTEFCTDLNMFMKSLVVSPFFCLWCDSPRSGDSFSCII